MKMMAIYYTLLIIIIHTHTQEYLTTPRTHRKHTHLNKKKRDQLYI